jgi:hypothetical protein
MTGDRIKYQKGYKYQLVDDYSVQTRIRPETDIITEFITLSCDGVLWIRHGYAWDGASGPTVDTDNSIRASLVHDALYQLMRLGCLGQHWRQAADEELREICIEDGMCKLRASVWFCAVRAVAAGSAAVGSDGGKPVLVAP